MGMTLINFGNQHGGRKPLLQNTKNKPSNSSPHDSMKVKLLKPVHNLSNKYVYEVIGIEADEFRILNDANEPFLYDRKKFKIIEKSEPQFWKSNHGHEKEQYSYPEELNGVGFFEDYFDGNKATKLEFVNCLKQHYPKTFRKYSESSKIMNYLNTHHKNLFSSKPMYGFELIRINPKTIKLEIRFKKGQKYCCIEPICHFTPKWNEVRKYGKNRIEAKFVCESGSYCRINNKNIKNRYREFTQIFKDNQK
jgi:hypothetical protein